MFVVLSLNDYDPRVAGRASGVLLLGQWVLARGSVRMSPTSPRRVLIGPGQVVPGFQFVLDHRVFCLFNRSVVVVLCLRDVVVSFVVVMG